MRPLTIEGIVDILANRGRAQYGGEPVSQTEHALQCAALAERAGATPELISACLLHDLGHLLHSGWDDDHRDFGDDAHERIAAAQLSLLFPEAVLQPIRLHVHAKRYLCATEAGYFDGLSPSSKHSLDRQGGTFSENDAHAFIAQPYAADAVRLRRWDDSAKVPGRDAATPAHFILLTHFTEYLRACRRADEVA